MSDVLAGACVGLSQTLTGHPLDTIKVLIQNGHRWRGLSPRDYYRGWRFPLISSTLFNCTVFPMYERSKKYTDSSIGAGMAAGVAVTPVVYAFDVGKILQQTKQPINMGAFSRSKGFTATGVREVAAMGSYFGSYDYLRGQGLPPLAAGGAAGLINWTLTYPIDVVRSRQIAQGISMRDAIGLGHLWKGYTACAVRAVLVNGVSFWVYEKVKSSLDD